MNIKPVSPARPSVVSFICERQAALGLCDDVVAGLAHYPSRGVYRLVREGKMKVTIERIPDLARALQVEAGELLTVALAEYEPALLHTLQECWEPANLCPAERRMLEHARKVTGDRNRIVSVVVNGVPLLLAGD